MDLCHFSKSMSRIFSKMQSPTIGQAPSFLPWLGKCNESSQLCWRFHPKILIYDNKFAYKNLSISFSNCCPFWLLWEYDEAIQVCERKIYENREKTSNQISEKRSCERQNNGFNM